jgi:hypothetical protein
MLHTLLEIAKRASTCFILHNMLVSDRVMGDCRLLYDPAELVNTIKYKAKDVRQPSDLEDVQRSDRSPLMQNATPPTRADIGGVITTSENRICTICTDFDPWHQSVGIYRRNHKIHCTPRALVRALVQTRLGLAKTYT